MGRRKEEAESRRRYLQRESELLRADWERAAGMTIAEFWSRQRSRDWVMAGLLAADVAGLEEVEQRQLSGAEKARIVAEDSSASPELRAICRQVAQDMLESARRAAEYRAELQADLDDRRRRLQEPILAPGNNNYFLGEIES